ncbi:pyruvate kinase [Sedimentibacter sp. zth1]|uniref:pyruvate kinase n=1 Tax=Sedimentibacter sp. zth1 TaxID=2816908 RepID=UPI001A916B86|nr:pyruvate kinase [Sedimentibacter sp. zth1]QSX07139.1 pyruvate kinase [Sedimentibacter sp. zth1]
MRKTKIVCTIGPASEKEEVFKQLVLAGLNVARLNFSHGTHDEHALRINTIKKVREQLDKPVAIMLDTKGPEIRTRDFENGSIEVETGQDFILTTRDILGNKNICSVTYENFAKELNVDERVLIDDGLIALVVKEKINDTDVKCEVLNSGVIKNKKGVNVPDTKIMLPALTQKDIDDIIFGIEQDVDFIAASFIRKASDVLSIRKILEDNNAEYIQIISKIENREGVQNINEILNASDGIMVARGDLGVEIPLEEVPLVQNELITKCNKEGKPVITATQMLDSMIRNPRPTRAEVSDVATSIFEGTDAIMLSGETAAGSYPVEAVKTMHKIAVMIEDSLNYNEILNSKYSSSNCSITDSIGLATCRTCLDLKTAAIISATSSGYTAKAISKFRPKSPIIATTESERVMRQLSIYYGVYPIKTKTMKTTDEVIELSVNRALEEGYIENGDLVIITAGVPVGVSGSTNLLKIHIVSELLYKKVGYGTKTVTAKAVKAYRTEELEGRFNEGDILVMRSTYKDVVEYMEKASGIIVEEGGLTSHAFIVSMELGKEVVVGATDCMNKIHDGELLTISGKTGVVYRGEAKIL